MTPRLACSALAACLIALSGCAGTHSTGCACCDLHRQGLACTGKACR